MAPQLIVMNGLLARGERAVDLARDQLLAGAGLAGDQHRDVGGRDLLDLAEHLLHRRRRADDLAEADLLEALVQQLVVELAAR